MTRDQRQWGSPERAAAPANASRNCCPVTPNARRARACFPCRSRSPMYRCGVVGDEHAHWFGVGRPRSVRSVAAPAAAVDPASAPGAGRAVPGVPACVLCWAGYQVGRVAWRYPLTLGAAVLAGWLDLRLG